MNSNTRLILAAVVAVAVVVVVVLIAVVVIVVAGETPPPPPPPAARGRCLPERLILLFALPRNTIDATRRGRAAEKAPKESVRSSYLSAGAARPPTTNSVRRL